MTRRLGRSFGLVFAMVQACSDAGDGPGVDIDESRAGGGRSGDDGGSGGSDAATRDSATTSLARDAATSASSGARDAGPRIRDAQAAEASMPAGLPGTAVASGPSAGCGKPTTDRAGAFTPHTVRVDQRDRTYQLFVPEAYDPKRPYPVVVRFHGTSGNGLSGGLDLQNGAPREVIVVAPDGVNTTWRPGEADVALFDALVSSVGEQLCVDRGRLFAYGFSAGAGITELLSCIRGDVLRGVAAVAGYDWGRGRACVGNVAAWLAHDLTDTSAPIAGGRAARDRILQQNACSNESEPAGESCVRYRGCADGHPVVWCETEGLGHNIRGDYAPAEVWKFFSGLK